MDVQCKHCGHRHTVSEAIFGGRKAAVLTCAKCKRTFEVMSTPSETLQLEPTKKKLPRFSPIISPEGQVLELPEDCAIVLKVLEGEEKDTVYPLTKPRTLLGRSNADIVVGDEMSSRLHCALEVSNNGVMLRDLASTNGTFVDDQPIKLVRLKSGSTFRIGKHLFQLVITPQEP